MTDESAVGDDDGARVGQRESVNHGIGEYVRGEAQRTRFKAISPSSSVGITGTYHSVSQKHLKRYLAKFDFRYNERVALKVSDAERAAETCAAQSANG